MTTADHFCPVCRRDKCDHLLVRNVRRDTLDQLRQHVRTPLDMGMARFTADVLELIGAERAS